MDLVKAHALGPLIVRDVMEAITMSAFSMRQADPIFAFYDKVPVTVTTLLATIQVLFSNLLL